MLRWIYLQTRHGELRLTKVGGKSRRILRAEVTITYNLPELTRRRAGGGRNWFRHCEEVLEVQKWMLQYGGHDVTNDNDESCDNLCKVFGWFRMRQRYDICKTNTDVQGCIQKYNV